MKIAVFLILSIVYSEGAWKKYTTHNRYFYWRMLGDKYPADALPVGFSGPNYRRAKPNQYVGLNLTGGHLYDATPEYLEYGSTRTDLILCAEEQGAFFWYDPRTQKDTKELFPPIFIVPVGVKGSHRIAVVRNFANMPMLEPIASNEYKLYRAILAFNMSKIKHPLP